MNDIKKVQRTATQEILWCAAPSFYITSICSTNIFATLSLSVLVI